MNFLAHLWLADRSNTSMPGAILGDIVRGRDLEVFGDEIALGIRLHRHVDAITDRHPVVVGARSGFPAEARRFAGILLDLACDHLLARRWAEFSTEPLNRFASRAARQVALGRNAFERAGAETPEADRFARLLIGYREESGIDEALDRIALRSRSPDRLQSAAAYWRDGLEPLGRGLPELLGALLEAADALKHGRPASNAGIP